MGLILLLAVTALSYYPSLQHVARADQISFLAEYAGRDNSLQTLTDAMYYNRTRTFSPGDAVLFRPLLFLMLFVQKMIFGYLPFWWQVTALGAHLFTVTALWRLLRRWSGDERGHQVAMWVTLGFFALLFSNMEAVIWHGITPYVFFAGFMLLALEALDRFIESKGMELGSFWTCSLLLLLAVLTYEAGILYILCFTGYALLRLRGTGKVRWGWGFLLPLLIYAGWSYGHWVLAGIKVDPEAGKIMGLAASNKTAGNFLMVLKWFISGGFFLQPVDILMRSRLTVLPSCLSSIWPLNDWLAVRWAGVAAGAGLLLCTGAGMLNFWGKTCWRRVGLLAAMLIGYLCLITIGRANTRVDGTGLECSLYYFYNCWVLFAALMYLLIREMMGRNVFIGFGLAMMIVIFSGMNGVSVYRVTSSLKESCGAIRSVGRLVDKFVQAHRNEKDFSFYYRPGEPGNYVVSWLQRKTDPPGKQYSLIEAYYPQYFNAEHPKYRLKWRTP